MADLILTFEKVAGAGDAKSSCAIFNRRVTLADSSVGTIVGCLMAKSDDADVQIIIRDLVELAASKLEGYENGVLAALVHVRDLSVNFIADRKVSVDFAYLVFYKDVCYIVRLGDGVKVQVFDPPKSGEVKFSEGSGPVEPGQIYVIATDRFLTLFDTAVFAQEAEIEFREIIDGLATEISAESEQSQIGAAFVQISEEAEKPFDLAQGKGTEPAEEDTGAEEETAESTAKVELMEAEGATERRSVKREAPLEEEVTLGEAVELSRDSGPTSKFIGLWGSLVREAKKLRAQEVVAVGRLRRNIVVLALVILLILAGSVSYAVYKNQQKKKLEQLSAHLTAAASKLSEGAAVAELNRSRAREIFVEADREVDLALEIDSKSEKAKSIKEGITGKLKETDQSANVGFETFFEADVGLVTLAAADENLIAVSESSIFAVATASESSEKLDGKSPARLAAVYDRKVYLVTDKGVARVDIASRGISDLFDHSGAQDIGVFLGNVYLMSGNKIDKYVPIEAGYSGPSDYLSSAEQFSERSHLAIDGLVWVTSGPKILKFNRGERQDFEISGAPPGIADLGIIYTSSSLDNLYVIDAGNSALLVIGKDGAYKRSYQSPEFSRASGLVVTEDDGKIYITSGTKVLEANLE